MGKTTRKTQEELIEEAKSVNKTVKIKALKVKEEKQHMVAGKVYEVSEEDAKHLIAKKFAEKA